MREPDRWSDYEKQLVENVAKFGWSATYVGASESTLFPWDENADEPFKSFQLRLYEET